MCRPSPSSPRREIDPADRSHVGIVGGGTQAHEESRVLRTQHHRGSRHAVGLLLCGAVLVAPLVLVQEVSDASATPDHGRLPSADAGSDPAGGPSATPSRLATRTRPVVIADSSVRHDLPTTTAATNLTSNPAVVPVTIPAATTTIPALVTTTTTTTTTLIPPTTTTTVPVVVGSDRGSGQVTYYAHPAGRCASPWLPFGTVVTITNPATGATVVCTVDDREADTARAIDLATATFAQLAPLPQGVVDARLRW